MIQALAYLANARCFFDCISSTAYRSPYSHTVLNADGRIHAVTCVRFFLSFSLYKFLHLLTFAHLFFSALPFFNVLFLYPILTFIALNFILLRASIDATISLSVSLFDSSQSSRNVRLLTTHIPPYSPRVVVIMLIMSTLGWCYLDVVYSKISVFFSIDSLSTGSLTVKSRVVVFSFLSPLITVAVIKRKSSLQVSAT